MGTVSDLFFPFKERDRERTRQLTSHIYTWMGVILARHFTVVIFGSEGLISCGTFPGS